MNIKLKKFGMALGGAALIGGSLFAAQGTSNAETVAEFRLSNFSATVANLCVKTDIESVCSGDWPTEKSEVFNVRYNDPNAFQCTAFVLGSSGDQQPAPRSFSRNEFKECKINGIVGFTKLVLIRPDGTEA